MIILSVTLLSIPIEETDGIPSHAPRYVKLMGDFNGFPVFFGRNQGTAKP